MSDAYAPNKLAAHPEVLADLRAGGPGRLISVHLMPMNTCNQRCTFCSYRMPENKNAEDFNEGVHLNAMAMLDLLAHFSFIGVQGVEVTGGGEPLAYPHTDALWKALKHHNFATALVTNGTLLKDRAPLICDSRLKWVRVSIDAARESTYALMRKAPPKHFVRAWNAVEEFRKHAPKDPEFRLGVGFVLSNENWTEVYDFVRMARDHGADNVRLSSTFSDKQLAYFGPDVDLKAASAASEQFVGDGASGAGLRALHDEGSAVRRGGGRPGLHLLHLHGEQEGSDGELPPASTRVPWGVGGQRGMAQVLQCEGILQGGLPLPGKEPCDD
jgi:organic radical activating enzyme